MPILEKDATTIVAKFDIEMISIHDFLFLIGSTIFLIKLRDEKRLFSIIYQINNRKIDIYKSIKYCILLIIFSIIFCVFNVFLNIGLLLIISRVSILISIIIFFIIRTFKLYNSIEEIYFNYILLAIIFIYVFPNYLFAWVSSLSVLISSVSAGISKINCNLWNPFGSKLGFAKFSTLPTASRLVISNFFNRLIKRNKSFKILFQLITLLVPLIQLFSPLVILGSLIIGNNISLLIGYLFQISFIISLFVLVDFTIITLCYSWLLLSSYLLIPDQIFILSFSSFLSIIYLVTICISMFLNVQKESNSFVYKIEKFIRMINFNSTPFKVFTKAHIENMCTFYVSPLYEENKTEKFLNINGYQNNGMRSKRQNFHSIHLHALTYPITDFIWRYFKTKKISTSFKNHFHEKQIMQLFDYIKRGEITIWQHCWDNKNNIFLKEKVGKIIIDKTLNDYIKVEILKRIRMPREINV